MNLNPRDSNGLHEAGHDHASHGQAPAQPGRTQGVTSFNDVHEQSKPASAATGENHSPNRTATEQEQNGDGTPSEKLAIFTGTLPPDLVRVVAAWPRLPDAIKAGMVAMVKAAMDDA